jgi:beta-xylosidase
VDPAAVMRSLGLLVLLGTAPLFAQPWRPDLGDGHYKNPIIFADYSDPDVVRVGDDYWMTASSFNAVPALPILHSKDLVNWRIVNHAISRLSPEFDVPQLGNGVWAPSITFHRGWFYIYYGDPDRGIYMVKTRDPRRRWTAPVLVKAAKGWIDPSPLWDDDGRAYLVHAFANSRAAVKSILHVNRLSEDGTRVLDEGTLVFDGREHHPTIEGPKFYKRDGWYYIFAPAGGVKSGWQTVLRSRNVLGPYEDRIVLAQGRTAINGPHQGAWVELPNGDGWFVHFQDRGPYGRITHLQPLAWKNGWPVIGSDPDADGTGEPVFTHRKPDVGREFRSVVPQTSDEFDDERLGRQWQWQGNPRAEWWSLGARRGHLRLFPPPMHEGTTATAPNALLQKFPAPSFIATAKIDARGMKPHDMIGLVVFGREYAFIGLHNNEGRINAVRTLGTEGESIAGEQLVASQPVESTTVYLRVTVDELARCRFSYSTDGRQFVALGDPFQAREGRWVGAKVGLVAFNGQPRVSGGSIDVDYFRVR